MTSKTRLLLASAFLALGFATVLVVAALAPSDSRWEAQMNADAETALSIFSEIRGGRLPVDLSGQDEVWEKWDRRMGLYDAAHRAELGARLRTYVDFIAAEHADAAAIYRNGSDPGMTSETARAARAAVLDRLGELGPRLLEDADRLREEAYSSSPAHSGLDPDLTDFVQENEIVRTWAPLMHELIGRMVADPDKRTER